MKQEDVSNKTVMLLLVLVIVVSIVSFGFFFSAMGDAEPVVLHKSGGKLSLYVNAPRASMDIDPTYGGGKLGLSIVEPAN